ncbi:probable disease resistance RPP8-like protein 4 isoform X9 [Quercus robur]|uniref:probable disease resistance RPP8-like protein 4 isoform X9 n=1 Tax=Quercus robur TaxID=38942 RepID=UPI0021632D39|nr:probable disease resistance RPP8-like protein 4 isoform X9 [Quercus robur]
MAEAAISALTEKLISLLSEEATLLQDIHEEVADIKDELESIQSFLKDADARAAAEEDMSEGVKTWVKQVKEVAFHMDVFMDEYLLEMAQHHPHRLQGFSWFLHKSARLFSMLKPHHETATKIQKIKASVQKIKARSERYGFQSTGQGSSSGTQNVRWQDPRKDSLYLEDTDVVGIESSRNELIGWLVEGQPHRIVISVVGMGGLGKTTLAKKIYDHQMVRGHFECYAWISVSQSYNIQDLLRSIIKQFREARNELPMPGIDTMDEQSLVNNQVLLNNVNTNFLEDSTASLLHDFFHTSRCLSLTTSSQSIVSHAWVFLSEDVADRVCLGLIPTSEGSWVTAVSIKGDCTWKAGVVDSEHIFHKGIQTLGRSGLLAKKAKPRAKELKNKPIPNYDKLVELYGKDRATGEQSEIASEMRQWWATSIGEGSMENIEDIDHLVAQNEVTLESCDNVGDNNVGEASSKAKKREHQKMRTWNKLWEQFRMLL